MQRAFSASACLRNYLTYIDPSFGLGMPTVKLHSVDKAGAGPGYATNGPIFSPSFLVFLYMSMV